MSLLQPTEGAGQPNAEACKAEVAVDVDVAGHWVGQDADARRRQVGRPDDAVQHDQIFCSPSHAACMQQQSSEPNRGVRGAPWPSVGPSTARAAGRARMKGKSLGEPTNGVTSEGCGHQRAAVVVAVQRGPEAKDACSTT